MVPAAYTSYTGCSPHYNVQPHQSTDSWWLHTYRVAASVPDLRSRISVVAAPDKGPIDILPTTFEQLSFQSSLITVPAMVHFKLVTCQIALYLLASTATAQLPTVWKPYDAVTYFCERWYHQCTLLSIFKEGIF
jgi:hypothetical protein